MREFLVYLKRAGKTNRVRIGEKLFPVPGIVRLTEEELQLAQMNGVRLKVLRELRKTEPVYTLPSMFMPDNTDEQEFEKAVQETTEQALSELFAEGELENTPEERGEE